MLFHPAYLTVIFSFGSSLAIPINTVGYGWAITSRLRHFSASYSHFVLHFVYLYHLAYNNGLNRLISIDGYLTVI